MVLVVEGQAYGTADAKMWGIDYREGKLDRMSLDTLLRHGYLLPCRQARPTDDSPQIERDLDFLNDESLPSGCSEELAATDAILRRSDISCQCCRRVLDDESARYIYKQANHILNLR